MGGRYRWRSAKLTHYTVAQGLASNSIYELVEDHNGKLLVSGPGGISVMNRRDLDMVENDSTHRVPVTLYGISEGLETIQMCGGEKPAGVLTAQGEVWFPSSKGPVRVSTDQPPPSNPAPVPDRQRAPGYGRRCPGRNRRRGTGDVPTVQAERDPHGPETPGDQRVRTITAIHAEHPDARFIVVTTYEGDEDIHRALEAGAQGYIIKGMPYQVLVQALQRVNAGGRFLPPPVAHALASRMPDSDLSARKLEVLNLLVAGKSNKDIAQLLDITEATVKSHVSAILMRLNVNDRTQAVVTALQRGLVHL
jgi:DNA-binding NarL/FixJ family response regulator